MKSFEASLYIFSDSLHNKFNSSIDLQSFFMSLYFFFLFTNAKVLNYFAIAKSFNIFFDYLQISYQLPLIDKRQVEDI